MMFASCGPSPSVECATFDPSTSTMLLSSGARSSRAASVITDSSCAPSAQRSRGSFFSGRVALLCAVGMHRVVVNDAGAVHVRHRTVVLRRHRIGGSLHLVLCV